jgi:hypothetical protein
MAAPFRGRPDNNTYRSHAYLHFIALLIAINGLPFAVKVGWLF